LWNEELLEHVQIHDTGYGRLHEEGAIHCFFAEGAKHIHLWAVTNMFQGGTWIFAAPNLAVVGIDLTTDMKRAFITENYGVQKFLMEPELSEVKLGVLCYITTVPNVVYVLCINLYTLSKS
jgi:hypothetical protein